MSLEAHSFRMIETEAGHLAVRQIGKGAQVLVLWPAIFSDHRIHLDLARKLNGLARVVLIDGSGHGQSGPSPQGSDIAVHARAMGQVMAATGLTRAVVGGTSWGALAGADLALIRPDLVAGVVMMNLPIHMGKTRPGLQERLIVLGARTMLRSTAFRNGIARSFFAPETRSAAPEALAAFHAMLRKANTAALSRSVASVMLRDAAWRGAALVERLARISAPVLMVAGRDDALYPLADQRLAAAGLRRGTLVEAAGRHISPVDAPETVARAVMSLLGGLATACS